jgi:hypothetical protein
MESGHWLSCPKYKAYNKDAVIAVRYFVQDRLEKAFKVLLLALRDDSQVISRLSSTKDVEAGRKWVGSPRPGP